MSRSGNPYPLNLIEAAQIGSQHISTIESLLSQLKDRQAAILKLYYRYGLTFQSIGNLYGFSRERANQYRNMGLRSLRKLTGTELELKNIQS